MKPRGERERSQAEVINAFRRDLSQVAGARAFPRAFGLVQGQRSEPLQFVVKGPNLQEMGRLAGELQRTLQADPQIGRMDTDLQLDLPQLVLEPDRVRAAGLSLTSADVALAVSMLTGGIDIAKYNDYPGRRRALRHPRQGEGRRIPAAGRPRQRSTCATARASWCASTRWRASARRSARP